MKIKRQGVHKYTRWCTKGCGKRVASVGPKVIYDDKIRIVFICKSCGREHISVGDKSTDVVRLNKKLVRPYIQGV